jgi:hypothetical protein
VDANSDEKPLSNGVGRLPSEPQYSLVDALNRIADALERQTLLLADLLNQNSVILESLLDEGDEEDEQSEDMEGNPITVR